MLDYNINPRGIACEHFDDETIILNLPKGNYYSLKGSGQFIWSQWEKGAKSDQIVVLLSEYYLITASESLAAFEAFVSQLVQEELIIPSASELPVALIAISDTSSLPFILPVLEVYSDMQELLMLDPIHDADPGKGWPHQNNV